MEKHQLEMRTRRLALEAQIGVYSERAGQIRHKVGGYKIQRDSVRTQQRLVQEELKAYRQLYSEGYAPAARVRAIERAAADLTGRDGALRSDIGAANEQLAELEFQLQTLRHNWNEKIQAELRETDIQLAELSPRLKATRFDLESTRIRAPVAGHIIGFAGVTIGSVAKPGETLMEIVPDTQPILVEVRLRPHDADSVRPAMKSIVRIQTGLFSHARNLSGSVHTISADRMVDPRTGEAYFRTEITIPERDVRSELSRLNVEADTLKPGLPVEAVIPLRSRSTLSYLLEPLNQAMWRSMKEY